MKGLSRRRQRCQGPLLTFEGGAQLNSALARHQTATAMSAQIITWKRSTPRTRFLISLGTCWGARSRTTHSLPPW
jgi:hypothetical protein